MTTDEKWLSTTLAADLLGCCEDTILKLIYCGAIDAIRHSNRGWWRISRVSCLAYEKYLLDGGSLEDWLELRRREKEVLK